jgi:thymidylate synthase (FAD)
MRIAQPSIKVLAYSQLVPDLQFDMIDTSPTIIGAHTKLLAKDPCSELARIVERCGRISWKSEDKIGPGTADGFCTRVVNIRKDESIAEHASVTMIGVTDRYTSHQLVRHRIAAYTQESTHYINYGKKGEEIEVMESMGIPKFCEDGKTQTLQYSIWHNSCLRSEADYMQLLKLGVHHKNARFVLPSCLKTEIAFTFNLRTWRHVLNLRIPKSNTQEISFLLTHAGYEMARLCPEMFSEFKEKQ